MSGVESKEFKIINPTSVTRTPASQKGQAALSLVLLISGVIILAALIIAFLVASFTNATLGFRASNKALALATAGAQDAVLRAVRDRNFPAGLSQSYVFEVGPADVADVTAARASDGVTITSDARVFVYRRRVEVKIGFDPTTGEAAVLSWGQVPF
ncbi:MAG: hypothetical protein HY436_00025 [Candidatus Liptonbacteria bacterium]|nr:hypothetical protein [Candidatus Liptonbacteria bacterium]